MKRKLLSLALACAMATTMLPSAAVLAVDHTRYVSAAGDDGADGSQSAPYATLEAAYGAVPDGGSIILLDSLTLERQVSLDEDKAVSISGAMGDESITYTGRDTIPNADDGMIAVRAGAVTFRDVTLQLPETPGVNGRVLYVGPGGEAVLESGGTVAHGYLAYDGGGVLVDGGSFAMRAGSAVRDNYIANNTDCYGGGVSVKNGGSFVMEGGAIENNTVHTTQSYGSFGGGVAVDASSNFTMRGGSIRKNRVDTHGGGVYVHPGAQVALGGNITVHGNLAGEAEDNLFLPLDATIGLSGTVSGQVGVTCEGPDYHRVVAVPEDYAIRTLDEGAFHTDDGAYDIRLKDGNLVLYWFTVPVALHLDGVDSENSVTETPIGQDYDTVLVPQEGFLLPDRVTVAVGGGALDEDSFTYDPSTGALHIPGEQVAGAISLSVSGDAIRTVRVSAQNVRSDVEATTAIFRDTVVIHLTAADRYALPGEGGVTVSGTCDHAYDPSTGVLTLTHIASDVSISVHGAEVYHTISFDPGEGSCAASSKTIPESQPTLGDLPTPSLEGYTFSGWFAGDERVTADTPNHLTGDLSLTARWTRRTDISYVTEHWVEYLSGGVNPGYTDGALQSMTHDGVTRQYYLYQSDRREDGISNGRLDLAQRTLTAFAGGLSMAGLTPSGANVYEVVVSPDGSSVFPLFYDRVRCTVRYDANGGSMRDMSTTVAYGGRYAVMPTANRAGYTLLGWYTAPNGGTRVQAGDVWTAAQDVTLYAHWTPVGDTPYTVYHLTQNLRDNTVSWDKAPENYTLAHTDTFHGTSDATVDLYAMALEGFTPSASNTYTLTILPDGSAAAYLYYDRLRTDVSFDSAGGSPVTLSMRLYYGGTFAFVPAAPSRPGYTFAGWYTGPAPTDRQVVRGTEINVVNPESAPNLTLYAHWTPKTYELIFEAHGGVLSAGKSVTYGQSVGELPTAALTGYIFQGWYDRDGKLGVPEGNRISEDTVVTTDTLIEVKDGAETVKPLYAWYEPMKVTLTFDSAGGSLEEEQRARTLTYDKPLGVLPVPERAGYTLRAWRLNSLDGEVLTAETICKLTGNAVAVAEYVPNVYAVKLDPNGGEADLGNLLVTYDEPYGPLPTPVRTGYTFLGWFREDGTLVTADAVLHLTAGHTLTARWEAVRMTVSFDVNGGDALGEDVANKAVTFGSAYGALPTPTRPGNYIFDGWYTQEKEGIRVTEETVVTDIADHILYAHWRRPRTGGGTVSRPVKYTVTFDTNGGLELPSLTVASGTKVDLTQYLPQRDGHTFLGWFADGAATQSIGDSMTVTSDATIYAKWEKEDTRMAMLEREAHDAYIIGFPDGTVRPEASISRGEVAQIFYRLLTAEARERYHASDNPYLDVLRDAWYHDAVSTLTAMGILKGRGGGRFAPDSPITRAEFAVLAARFSDERYDGGDLFTDISDSWARLEINRAASLGWVEGDPSGAFRPNDKITRAEAVALINRVLGRVPKSKDALLPEMRTFPDNDDPGKWYYLAIQEAANGHTYIKNQAGEETWKELK